jgi:hypothetical protein
LTLRTSEDQNGRSAHTWYDLKTGKELRGIEKRWTKKKSGKLEEELSLVTRGERHSLATVAVWGHPLPEGWTGMPFPRVFLRFKQSASDSPVFWEKRIGDDFRAPHVIAFAPDDRAILTTESHFDEGQTTWVSLLESLSGEERTRFVLPSDVVVHWRGYYVRAFSKNGNLMAVATNRGTAVFDIRRAKEVAWLDGDQGPVRGLAFGAEETIFTAGSDGTVLIWDLRDHLRKARKLTEISPDAAKRLWAELASPDTAKAYQALAELVNAPDQAVKLLGEQLKPAVKAPVDRIEKVIALLEDKDFKTRENATRELRQMGNQAKTALQASLSSRRSVEFNRRVDELLADVKQYNPNELREFRAVEILEVIGTPAAKSILESIAKGAPGIKLTDEALAALERLEKNK